MNGLVEELEGINESITLLGFSMGAMTALLASNEISVENLILYSPSGYFKEYVPLLNRDDRDWGQKNIIGFEQLSAIRVVDKAQAMNGYLIAGSKEFDEWPDFKQWIHDLKEQRAWNLTVVPDTAHEIEADNYLRTVADLINRL